MVKSDLVSRDYGFQGAFGLFVCLLLAASLLVTTMAARELAETAKEETREAAVVKPDGYDTQYHHGSSHYGGDSGSGGVFGGYYPGRGYYPGGGYYFGGGPYGGFGGCYRCCYYSGCGCCATAEEAARVNALGKPQN